MIVQVDTAILDVALDALLTRVRWYVLRGYRVPAMAASAFNEIADLTDKPHTVPWERIA